MLVGVPRPELCEPLARVLQSLGVRRAMVVCGKVRIIQVLGHLDELSTLGRTRLPNFIRTARLCRFDLSPEQFPCNRQRWRICWAVTVRPTRKLSAAFCAAEERGPKRDAVLLNVAAALFVAGETKSLVEGWNLAAR